MGVANVPSAQGNQSGDYLRYKDESSRTMDKLRSRCVSEGHGIFGSVPFVDRRETRRCDWPAHDLTDATFGQRWAIQRVESFEPILWWPDGEWWSEFETALAQIMSAQEPSKPRRHSEDMLEEILSLVRSIDKATNFTRLTFVPGNPGQIVTADVIVEQFAAQNLKEKLVAEVAKSSPVVAETLGQGSLEFSDETLILKFAMYLHTGFEHLIKPPYSAVLKKAADALGYRVKLVQGLTSFDV
jgi:hypothetical protein